MADSRRVFVQLAGVKGSQVEVGAPVMAFVMPTDSWLSVVNEFLMVTLVAYNTLLVVSYKAEPMETSDLIIAQ